jgi:hypothetical protein
MVWDERRRNDPRRSLQSTMRGTLKVEAIVHGNALVDLLIVLVSSCVFVARECHKFVRMDL